MMRARIFLALTFWAASHVAAATILAVALTTGTAYADADRDRGAKAFRQCAACHSLKAGDHRTGPSLGGIWGKTAGSIATFNRYSDALKGSGIVWNADTLDRWIKDPKTTVPGNRMVFRGVAEKRTRDDLIAFLKSAAASGMAGVGGEMPDLKQADADNRVTAMVHCKDTFSITTADGETHPFWTQNLRLKVDAGDNGPPAGKPVLIPAGMMGDRASVVFAAPDEISAFIKKGC